MRLQRGSYNFTIEQPLEGYTSSINVAIVVKKGVSNYFSKSRTSTKDAFRCTFELVLPLAETINLNNLLNNDRDDHVTISDFAGFYPFSPMVSDTTINVMIQKVSQRNVKFDDRGGYFKTVMTIVPNQTLTVIGDIATRVEGSLGFAGLTGLQDCGNGFVSEYSVNNIYSNSKNWTIDFATDLDHKTFNLSLKSCADNTGMLLKKLITVYRHLPIPIVGASNYYLSGGAEDDDWSGNVGLLTGEIEIIHSKPDTFDYGVKLYVI